MDDNRAILVTGSAGLIGSLLVKQLKAAGKHVLQLDTRLPTDHLGYGDFCNVKHLSRKISRSRGIIHLAGISRVVWGEQNPQACWDINVTGTQKLLEAAYQSFHQPWVLYASSREVYGQKNILPVSETTSLDPLNVYARSKVAAENLISHYQQQGLIAATLRFSSVYGSINDHPDRVIPAFCRNAVIGQPLRVDGLHNQFDFTHVQDTVRGILNLVAKLDNKINHLPPIHLTTGIGSSLLDVINHLEHILGRPIDFYEAPARTYDVHRFYGDPQQARTILNWKAQISLKQGLADLVKQFQVYYSFPQQAFYQV